MRRPILFLLLCLPVVFGAIFFGDNQPSGTESSAMAGAELTRVAPTPSTSSDTADVHCPVGPKRGDATITVDSTGKLPRMVTVKPDSQLAAEFNIELANEMKLVARADLNQDGRRDPIIKAQYEGRITEKFERPYMALVGCGGDRYASVTPPLPLAMDRVRPQLSSETAWPDLTTLREVNVFQKLKGYYYHQTYRFDEESGQYRLVPGSARYRKESARRLGIDLSDRPKCTVGKGPPTRIQPADGFQKPLQSGDIVSIKPIYKSKKYEIEWIGALNSDGRNDLIIERGCSSTGRCTFYVYYNCFSEKYWYQLISGLIVSGHLTPKNETKNGWRVIKSKGSIKGKVENIFFEHVSYKE